MGTQEKNELSKNHHHNNGSSNDNNNNNNNEDMHINNNNTSETITSSKYNNNKYMDNISLRKSICNRILMETAFKLRQEECFCIADIVGPDFIQSDFVPSDFSQSPSSCSEDGNMEWLVMNMDRFFAPSIQLGCFVADKYIASSDCKTKIDEILRRLEQDKARWHFRRSLFMNKLISKNLLPTLVNVKEDRALLQVTVKLLQELMTPVECLMPVNVMGNNVDGYQIINELERSISNAKKLFLDTKITKALIDLMNSLLQDSKRMEMQECELINQCLLLIRNLLHVSTVPNNQQQQQSHQQSGGSRSSGTSGGGQSGKSSTATQSSATNEDSVLIEDQLLWNLFAQRFDNILIKLLTCNQQHLWSITMVQLVSLMYREQQQCTIRKLIHEWLELSLSESSEDDENNPMTSSSSDAISTSDPVSDSSERLSPVDLTDEKVAQDNLSSMNNRRPGKPEKDDSCKDSGFGRSGSNMDSSPDDSVSETTQRRNQISNSQEIHDKLLLTGQIINEAVNQGFLQGHKRRSEDDNCDLRMGFKKMACEDYVRENGERRSGECSSCGSEGGSERSSPELRREQESPLSLENDSPCSDHFNQEDNQQENMISDVNIADAQNNSSPMQEDVAEEQVQGVEDGSTLQNVCPNQDRVKRPPKEELSGSSGDSSEKPPPQLPKLHKPLTGQKRSRHVMSQKMLSETQENNESSNSTGSECDEGPQAKRPHHQKPHKMLIKPRPAKMLQKSLQERNIKRNKLMKRKDSNGIKAKALLHHRPTPEDISNLLKEFTIDFMLNGYSDLVQGLRVQVMMPYQITLDKSHVLWLITYFLRFAVELDLELYQVCPVLSVETISYLVYEGAVMQEELEVALRAGESNTAPYVRRLHLVVTALREFFVALDTCLKKENLIDIKEVLTIKEEVGQLAEVRQLFVLLIRMYRPGVLNLNYLQDLIITNHRFLTNQEASSLSYPSMPSFNIVNHVKQFATMDMMRQYGRLLENFNVNDEIVNDCIFTMMHHVAGDLRNVNVLLQPCILRTFLRIWKDGFELCVDWADLIEYILRKCTRVRTDNPDIKESAMFPIPLAEPLPIELTNEDLDELYSIYKTTSSEQDLLGKIREICCDESIEEPIKKEVIQKLLARGFISSSECSKLCAEILPEFPVPSAIPTAPKSEGTPSIEIDVMQVSSDSEEDDSMDVLHETILQAMEAKKKASFNKSSSSDDLPKDTINSPYSSMYPPETKEHHDTADTILEGNMAFTEDSTDWDETETVTYLLDKLKEEGYSNHIQYLQLQLLEACFCKLKITGTNIPKPEPLAFHFTLLGQSIPVVPWTAEQEEVFSMPKFRHLLGKLGFLLSTETGKIYPRMPHFWSPDVLFLIAKRLGPINSNPVITTNLVAWKRHLPLIQMILKKPRKELATALWKTTIHHSDHHRYPS